MGAQLLQGQVHGFDGGIEDVDLVDFGIVYEGYCPAEGLAFDDAAQLIALFVGQLLTVVEQGVAKVARQHDCRGTDGSGQATATGFVAAGFEELLLVAALKRGARCHAYFSR